MAVYQALTLRLNPLKMDQIRKKNYIRSKDNQPKYEGGVDKEKRPLSLFLFLMARNTNISTLMHDRILFSDRYIYQIITRKYEFNLIYKWWLKGTQYTQ